MKLDLSAKDWDEFFRQCSIATLKCDSNAPVHPGETLEPCLRGCEKIDNDPELIEMLKNVYHGVGVE